MEKRGWVFSKDFTDLSDPVDCTAACGADRANCDSIERQIMSEQAQREALTHHAWYQTFSSIFLEGSFHRRSRQAVIVLG